MLGEVLHPPSPGSYAYVWGSTVNFASLLALSWPSMTARIHLLKLDFLCCFLSSEHDTLASRTFHTLASQDIYSLSVVQQSIFLDSKLGRNATASILSNTEDAKALLRKAKQAIIKQDNRLRLHAGCCQTVSQTRLEHQLATCLGDCPRQRPILDQNHLVFFQSSYPLFGDRCCPKCSTTIRSDISYCEHLVDYHCPSCNRERLNELLSELDSEFELTVQSFHLMVIVSCHCSIT